MTYHIETAQSADTSAVVTLLEQRHLPTCDLPTGLSGFIIAKHENELIGVAGLECFGLVGLLRSVAVDPQYRGQQVADRLVDQLLKDA